MNNAVSVRGGGVCLERARDVSTSCSRRYLGIGHTWSSGSDCRSFTRNRRRISIETVWNDDLCLANEELHRFGGDEHL